MGWDLRVGWGVKHFTVLITVLINDGEQGEWEGNVLDLVLSAMQAFPYAAFLGNSLFICIWNILDIYVYKHYKFLFALRYWFKHRKLLSGSCWNAPYQRGYIASILLSFVAKAHLLVAICCFNSLHTLVAICCVVISYPILLQLTLVAKIDPFVAKVANIFIFIFCLNLPPFCLPGDCGWCGCSKSWLHKEKPGKEPFVGKWWRKVDSQCCQVAFYIILEV